MNSPSKDVQEFAALLRTLAAESKQLVAAGIADLDPAAVSSSNSIEAESFLTLQSALMLSYTHHLLALSSHRMLGLSLSKDARGRELVSNLVRMRLQLENMRPIEARLKPKWERWIRASQAAEERRTNRGNQKARDDVIGDEDNEDDADDIDPLSFRPNPAALLDPTAGAFSKGKAVSSVKKSSSRRRAERDFHSRDSDDGGKSNGVYRPPKLAPVPYTGDRSRHRPRGGNVSDSGSDDERNRRRQAHSVNSHLLSDLSTALSNKPYVEASTGLATGSGSASGSKRAQRLREMEEYEEANFTRLVQSKKEARKRRRDEEDVALGGVTTARTGQGKVGAGFEEEFGDLLRGGDRKGPGA